MKRIHPAKILVFLVMIFLVACGGEDEPTVEIETEVPISEPEITETATSTDSEPAIDTDLIITVDETVQGVVQADNDPNEWYLSANEGDTLQLQVTRFTDTLLPAVRVFAPDGTGLGEFAARDEDFVLTAPLSITSSEHYRIEITGNGTEGQYAMKVLNVAEVAESEELAASETPSVSLTPLPSQTPTPSVTFSPTPAAVTPTSETQPAVTIVVETEELVSQATSAGGIEIVDSAINSPTPAESSTSEIVVVETEVVAIAATSEFAVVPTTDGDTSQPIQEAGTPTSEAAAQSGRLAVNETLSGSITQAGETQRYTFFGNATELYSLVVNLAPQNPGTLNPSIQVQAPNGEIIAENDDMIDGLLDAAVRIDELPATGVYIVYLKSADETGTGDYLITLGNQPYTLRDVERGEAVEASPNVDRLETYGARDVWTVDLNEGDIVSVSAEIVDPESGLDVMVELVSPEGESLDFDDDGGEGNDALMTDIPIPADGTYRIHVAAQNNASVGEYRLIWLNLNVASPTPLSSNTPLPTTPTAVLTPTDIPPTDTIDGFVEANSSFFYTIQAEAGQDVNIVVQGLNGFDPILRVYDATGTLVLEVDDVGQATDPRTRFVAEPSGLFLIEIVGFEGTGGSFTLSYIIQ